MKNTLDFFLAVGKLKGKQRRGWIVHGLKNSESTAEHIFRMAILAWVLGNKKKLNMEKVIKMALIHDICEVYAPDLTPYDPLLPKNPKDPKNIKKILSKWPKFSLAEKRKRVLKKCEKEMRGLNKLVSELPSKLRVEIKNLWLDFEKGLSPEGRFVKQIDKAENLLQGLEYWETQGKIQRNLWGRWAKEIFDDPVILEFVQTLDKRFIKRKKK